MRGDGDAYVVVGKEKPAVAAGDGAAGVEEPGLGAGGVHVQKLEEFLLKDPESEKTLLGDAEGAEVHHGLEEGEVGVGIAGTLKGREFKSVL